MNSPSTLCAVRLFVCVGVGVCQTRIHQGNMKCAHFLVTPKRNVTITLK
jgi:hypothetical protein